ncbi:MAG: hypothetical protein JW894_00225 [Bacteroidales bacterium]|nr:hypothetical protein [Bacteroidales bacterium]
MLKLIPGFLVLCFIFRFGIAQEDESEYELKSSDVENFIKEFPSIRSEFEKLQIVIEREDHEITLPEGINYMNDINNVVQKHGYNDYADFYMKAGTILSAYAAIKMEIESENLAPEYKQAIQEIENNLYYSAEQKEQMKQALEQSMSAVLNASENISDSENVKVVRPYTDKIEKAVEEE